MLSPMEETERTRCTPDAPFIADSIGKETSDSTSSGASPPDFGEDGNRGPVQIREDIDRQFRDDVAAIGRQQSAAKRHDEEPIAQRELDDPVEHEDELGGPPEQETKEETAERESADGPGPARKVERRMLLLAAAVIVALRGPSRQAWPRPRPSSSPSRRIAVGNFPE